MTDARWDDLLERHPRASVFHSRGWLEALKRTYGYEPSVLTTTASGPLENGVPFCRVKTWAARRLVSLPFSDHCDPLVDAADDVPPMIEFLRREMKERGYRSFELRPTSLTPGGRGLPVPSEVLGASLVAGGLAESARHCLHTLDLRPPLDTVFANFHHSSTQRAIRRAEREGLTCESGRSERLLTSFYYLLRLTRRRHGLPPQPLAWFWNLVRCLGDGVTVRVASKGGYPIASILTLSFERTLVYKYGGSDSRFHSLGGMPFLFWRAIQEAKAQGIEEMDLGRSDLDQPGLVAFKDHLGAARSTLTYYGYPARRTAAAGTGRLSSAARHVIAHLPDAALDLTGRLLYKHLG